MCQPITDETQNCAPNHVYTLFFVTGLLIMTYTHQSFWKVHLFSCLLMQLYNQFHGSNLHLGI